MNLTKKQRKLLEFLVLCMSSHKMDHENKHIFYPLFSGLEITRTVAFFQDGNFFPSESLELYLARRKLLGEYKCKNYY